MWHPNMAGSQLTVPITPFPPGSDDGIKASGFDASLLNTTSSFLGMPLPESLLRTAEPDIYVLPIDNYVDIAKVNMIIATGKPVILLFSEYHDEDNTIPAELRDVEVLKSAKAPNCVMATYNGIKVFQQILATVLNSL
jgi:hypothetical protein